MLPRVELWSSTGKLVTVASGTPTTQTININLKVAGTYYVLVKGLGDYGDVGQYTLSVDLGTPPTTTTGSGTTTKVAVLGNGGKGGKGGDGGNSLVNTLVSLNQAPASGAGAGLTALQADGSLGARQVAALANPSPLSAFLGISASTGGKGGKKGEALGGLPGNGLIQTLGIG